MSTDRATEQLEIAEGRWQTAVRDHAQPPPDAGLSRRLRALADAAAQEQTAYGYAAEQGFGWRPGPPWLPPHELRPAPWRPSLAPTDLWERFDEAVETLSQARTGVSVIAIARAFGQLAEAAWALEVALDGDHQAARRAGHAGQEAAATTALDNAASRRPDRLVSPRPLIARTSHVRPAIDAVQDAAHHPSQPPPPSLPLHHPPLLTRTSHWPAPAPRTEDHTQP